jgi:DNA polymerase III sliding clamp (beta) subunit (PCNA family)
MNEVARINPYVFKRVVKACGIATSKADWSPFNCIQITLYDDKTIKFTCTDRYRVAQATVSPKDYRSDRAVVRTEVLTIADVRAFAAMVKPTKTKSNDVCITFGVGSVIFQWSQWMYETSVVIDGEFPDVEKIITNPSNLETKLETGQNIRFNPTSFAQGLTACYEMGNGKATEAVMEFHGQAKPAFIRPAYTPEGIDFLYLIMPVRRTDGV